MIDGGGYRGLPDGAGHGSEAKTGLEEDRMFIQEKGRLVEASDMRPNLTSDLDKSLRHL